MNVTVVICTSNRAHMLRQTLEHIKLLEVPTNIKWELLIVDNNSTDDTQDVLASYLKALPLRTFFESRQGKSFACNLAIAEARGEILLWTDDDVRPDSDWLKATWNAFQQFEADIIFGVIRPLWLSHTPDWYSDLFSGKFALLDFGPKPFVISERRHEFHGANYAARKEVFNSLGGFREDLGPACKSELLGSTTEPNATLANGRPPTHLRPTKPVPLVGAYEDTDLFLRALDAGMKIVYDPRSVVLHMIDAARCTKGHHRRRTWRSSESHFRLLQAETTTLPRILSVPRYLYRLALADLWSYVKSNARLDRSASFYYELRLLQFAGLFRQALRHGQRATRRHTKRTAAEEIGSE